MDSRSHQYPHGYDGLDQIKSVTDPRTLTTSYTVNALGNATQQVSPDSGTTNRTFDEAGNMKSATDARSIQISYTYDALNRLTSATYLTTGENVTYIWDAGTGCTYGIGRLCQMTDSGGITGYAYDDQGNLVKATRTENNLTLTTQYNYDGANRPTYQVLPSGRTVTWERANLYGRIDTVTTSSGTTTTPLVKQITYDGAGQVTKQTLGNGVTLKSSYDLSGQPVTERFNKPDGDINQDGVVNIVDVLFAARIAEGLMTPTPDQIDHGDVAPTGNPNGKIDAVDVMRILRKVEKLENF